MKTSAINVAEAKTSEFLPPEPTPSPDWLDTLEARISELAKLSRGGNTLATRLLRNTNDHIGAGLREAAEIGDTFDRHSIAVVQHRTGT